MTKNNNIKTETLDIVSLVLRIKSLLNLLKTDKEINVDVQDTAGVSFP